MSDEDTLNHREAIKAAQKARLLEQFEQDFARKWAELERLASELGAAVVAPGEGSAAASVDRVDHKEHSRMTVGRLIELYRTDSESPFAAVRFRTRQHYESLLRFVEADIGFREVADFKAEDILALLEMWVERAAAKGRGDGKAMAHALFGQLRQVVNYGAGPLGDSGCVNLSFVLRNMGIGTAGPRKSAQITAPQAVAIRHMARKMGHDSIAFAQAIQFDCKLRQRDVIGEWVPETEPGESDLHHEGMKWLRGLRWEEIKNLVLRHTTSQVGNLVEKNLRQCSMVMEELTQKYGPKLDLPESGPVIVSEQTGLPWTGHAFRRDWREAARAAGVPDDVYNMDSRAKQSNRTDAPNGLRVNGHALHEDDEADFSPLMNAAVKLAWREPQN